MGTDLFNFLKTLLLIALILVVFLPVLFYSTNAGKKSRIQRLKYKFPDHKKNTPFIFLVIFELVLVALLLKFIRNLADLVSRISFLQKIFDTVNDLVPISADYFIFVLFIVVFNAIVLYGYMLFKSLFKKIFLDNIYAHKKHVIRGFFGKIKNKFRDIKKYGLFHTKKKKAKAEAEAAKAAAEAELAEQDRTVNFEHSEETVEKINASEGELEPATKEEIKDESDEEDKPKHRIRNFICGLFFYQEDDYIYPFDWVVKAEQVVQIFIWIVEGLYFILFTILLVSIFFPIGDGFAKFIMDFAGLSHWYFYPFFSILLLQEVCNIFKAKTKKDLEPKDEEAVKVAKSEKVEATLKDLEKELLTRFDPDHYIRMFKAPLKEPVPVYEYVNTHFRSALDFVKDYTKQINGRTVEQYMKIIDALYGKNNVYFGGSFYSEFGEYLIAYIYTLLLFGSRVIIVVPTRRRIEYVRNYISERLKTMAGLFGKPIWRVRTSAERLDQADVLIASSRDFMEDDLVSNNTVFFEEVETAVFLDADKMVEIRDYLCTIMSMRLKDASKRNMNYVFFSNKFYRGFASSNLPRLFNVENIMSFSAVNQIGGESIFLFNKESKDNRLYAKYGQNIASLETLIAETAYKHGVDGIKLISDEYIDNASRKVLSTHGVEINDFEKNVNDISYVVADDSECNLASALFETARFAGKYKSIVTVVSKPYLLREYFMYKIGKNDYLDRSAFIQPHICENVDYLKLSLLKLYLSCTGENSIPVKEFEQKCQHAFDRFLFSESIIDNEFWKSKKLSKNTIIQIENKNRSHSVEENVELTNEILRDFTYVDYAQLIIAGLLDSPDTEEKDSFGHHAIDYYVVSTPSVANQFSLESKKELYISFKQKKEIFASVLKRNKRVSLVLNDKIIGYLDILPKMVPSTYITGQTIKFNNIEYEIQSISADYCSIFLRHENSLFKDTFDTFFLKRFDISVPEEPTEENILFNSHGGLSEIKVSTYKNLSYVGQTYGYYTIMSDHQKLDLANGAQGNPKLSDLDIKKNQRNVRNGQILKLTLVSRDEVNDGARTLMSAVFNEFLKTVFPHAYHCYAIVPILEKPIDDSIFENGLPEDFNDRVKTLYPYLMTKEKEKDKHAMSFYFVNDCLEDVGINFWFTDKFSHYMEEFIANAYSYLHWLKVNNNLKHYIYFGGTHLPDCFDLDTCCKLLEDYNYVISEQGIKQYETAGADKVLEETNTCSFCHNLLESGRFYKFDDNRMICFECAKTSVRTLDELKKINVDVLTYMSLKYPEVILCNPKVQFMPMKQLTLDKLLTENMYKVDFDNNTIFVELDDPSITVRMSLLRAQIEFWQITNKLSNQYSLGQLYYEEMLYLRKYHEFSQANFIYAELTPEMRAIVDHIANYTGVEVVGDYDGNKKFNVDENGDTCTSFSYVRNKVYEFMSEEPLEVEEEEEGEKDESSTKFLKEDLRNELKPEVEETTSEEIEEVEGKYVSPEDLNPDVKIISEDESVEIKKPTKKSSSKKRSSTSKSTKAKKTPAKEEVLEEPVEEKVEDIESVSEVEEPVETQEVDVEEPTEEVMETEEVETEQEELVPEDFIEDLDESTTTDESVEEELQEEIKEEEIDKSDYDFHKDDDDDGDQDK